MFADAMIEVGKNIEASKKSENNPTAKDVNAQEKESRNWHTGLNSKEFQYILNLAKKNVNNDYYSVDERSNWLYTTYGGKDIFVIYSTIIKDDPTILLVSQKNQAKIDKTFIKEFIYEKGDEYNEIGRIRIQQSLENSEDLSSFNRNGVWLRNNGDGKRNGRSNEGYAAANRGLGISERPSTALLNIYRNDGQIRSGYKVSTTNNGSAIIMPKNNIE